MGLSLVSVLLGLVANQIHLFRTTNFGYAQSLFVDVRCECRNPECEEMKKAVGKANIKDNVASSSKSSNSAYFSFSNVNADPTLSTLDTLSSLKLISQLQESSNADSTVKEAYKSVLQSEMKFLQAEMLAVQNKRISDVVGKTASRARSASQVC